MQFAAPHSSTLGMPVRWLGKQDAEGSVTLPKLELSQFDCVTLVPNVIRYVVRMSKGQCALSKCVVAVPKVTRFLPRGPNRAQQAKVCATSIRSRSQVAFFCSHCGLASSTASVKHLRDMDTETSVNHHSSAATLPNLTWLCRL